MTYANGTIVTGGPMSGGGLNSDIYILPFTSLMPDVVYRAFLTVSFNKTIQMFIFTAALVVRLYGKSFNLSLCLVQQSNITGVHLYCGPLFLGCTEKVLI
jgi:hypothetical protein